MYGDEGQHLILVYVHFIFRSGILPTPYMFNSVYDRECYNLDNDLTNVTINLLHISSLST